MISILNWLVSVERWWHGNKEYAVRDAMCDMQLARQERSAGQHNWQPIALHFAPT
jgi:hypothetical protein